MRVGLIRLGYLGGFFLWITRFCHALATGKPQNPYRPSCRRCACTHPRGQESTRIVRDSDFAVTSTSRCEEYYRGFRSKSRSDLSLGSRRSSGGLPTAAVHQATKSKRARYADRPHPLPHCLQGSLRTSPPDQSACTWAG